ncbi:multiheme c-type cytochrome [Ferruginibacter profundus]
MKGILKYRSSLITLLFIVSCMLLFTKCINNEKDKSATATVTAYSDYAGSASCASCHKAIAASHVNTAHFHTSEPAAATNIKGSFDTGKNTFAYNTMEMIAMEKADSGLYQVAYINGVGKKRERFDITIGSGTKGQSYASWVGNKLVQLPITYFTSAGEWSNSPGYPNKIAFNRPVTSRCLECHATYAEKISAPGKEPEEFDQRRIVLGVDCERCHGPAAQHVKYQTQNPNDKTAKFIINPASFSRQQNLDMCALCHGGRLQKTKPSFQFKAGDKLPDFFAIDTTGRDINSIDVHGNQFGLLAASKCFKMSSTLTCNTCHDPHKNEKGNDSLFSQRCMNCHNDSHKDAVICKMTNQLGSKTISTRCTACHMPEQPSMAIAVLLQGKTTPAAALMHTHLVKNYPEETQKILALLKEKSTH